MGIVLFPRNTGGMAEVREGSQQPWESPVFLFAFPGKLRQDMVGSGTVWFPAESQEQGFGVTLWGRREVPWGVCQHHPHLDWV